MAAWQNINTAPKDLHTTIITGVINRHHKIIENITSSLYDKTLGTWVSLSGGSKGKYRHIKPTHWIPIPKLLPVEDVLDGWERGQHG